MSAIVKLLAIQASLKAPKSQYNSFGKYKYRNCEDILEALKPICTQYQAVVYLGDEIVQIGNRYYIKATVTLTDIEDGTSVSTQAYAREEESKKGMDGSQVTGASSSYARKYALNGMFDIDDTKDSDTTNDGYIPPPTPPAQPKEYKCHDCGTPFKPFTNSKGTLTAEDVYNLSQKKNADGNARCSECMKKESNNAE